MTRLTPEAQAAIDGAAFGKILATEEPTTELWEPTLILQIVRNESHRGRPERLQQRWYSRDTGKREWRDVPIVNE